MSILVNGMEMPKTCQICRTAKFDRIVGCEEWDRLSIAQRMYMRSETCPLIPLPEGHGRLGDAEAYVDYMQNRYDNNEITNGDWIDFRLSLKDQPTIVPAEGGEADGN